MKPQETEQRQQKHMGYSMIIAMWALIFGLLAFLFQDVLEKQHNPNQQLNGYITDDAVHELVLQRNH